MLATRHVLSVCYFERMWILLALVSAVATATRDPIYKKLLTIDVNPYILGGVQFLIAGGLLITVSIVYGLPEIQSGFIGAVAGTVILNIVATILVFKSIKRGEISLVAPLLSFVPAFAVVTSFLMLGELPTWWGLLGILIIIIGSYVLHRDSFAESLGTTYRRFLNSRAGLYMLIVAAIFSVSANFDKMAALTGTPLFASAIIDLILGAALIILSPLDKTHTVRRSIIKPAVILWFIPLGLLFAVGTWAQNTAFTLEIVPYVSAVVRTSAILTIFYGRYIFGEGHIRWRLLGAAIMLGGTILLVF